jgi:hypothetical protein
MNFIKFLIFISPALAGAGLYFSHLNLKSSQQIYDKMSELNTATSNKISEVALNQDILFEKIDKIKLVAPDFKLSDDDKTFISRIGESKIRLEFPPQVEVTDELINGKLPELPKKKK